MTFDKELFQSIDYTDRRKVEVGDGNLIDSIGTGTVVITLRDGHSVASSINRTVHTAVITVPYGIVPYG
jgi:methyl coenzyme M reductase subunit D